MSDCVWYSTTSKAEQALWERDDTKAATMSFLSLDMAHHAGKFFQPEKGVSRCGKMDWRHVPPNRATCAINRLKAVIYQAIRVVNYKPSPVS